MAKKSKYAEKYKDPRWQKKRLQVLERDEWNCQCCHDAESTLHIHHRYYEKGKHIWDYPLEAFITLCEECHLFETEFMPEALNCLASAFRLQFLSADIQGLGCAVAGMKLLYAPEVVISAYSFAFRDKKSQIQIVEKFLNRHKARKPTNDKKSKKS